MLEINKLYQGDCLDIMPTIADKSIDMILCDLPYGTTACSWDSVIPFEPLWAQYKRIIKDNGAIVLFGSQPFTTLLIMSNFEWFKYEWIWDKKRAIGFPNVNKQPLKQHEIICIFYDKQSTYIPQQYKKNVIKSFTGIRTIKKSEIYGEIKNHNTKMNDCEYGYPRSIINQIPVINNLTLDKFGLHPTQKPVALFEYLIRTYTNEGETVLDNCAGSGTTAIACLNTNRNYILIEKEPKYCDIIEKRIKDYQPRLF